MTATLWVLMLTALALTFANGANDNFKGVATLFGSGTASYRQALTWATVTTGAGCLTAMLLAGSLVARFSGRGLVPDALTESPTFLASVGGSAAITVFLASRVGLPISTTHALTGALVGAGLLGAAGDIRFGALGGGFVAPLLISPFVAGFLISIVYALAGAFAKSGAALDAAHYVSAGAVGFARGVNDTPKLLALLLPVQVLPPREAVIALTLVMAAGGLLGARRVAETISHRVTTMTPAEGFMANITTAFLVLFASRFGLPVSTTHVSSGALFGLGAISGGARWKTISQIVLAWVVTLPCAAMFAALLWAVLSRLG